MSDRLVIPMSVVLTDLVGAILAGVGIYGLLAESPPEWLPALGDPVKAGLLVALGGAMMTWAIGRILALAVRTRRR